MEIVNTLRKYKEPPEDEEQFDDDDIEYDEYLAEWPVCCTLFEWRRKRERIRCCRRRTSPTTGSW